MRYRRRDVRRSALDESAARGRFAERRATYADALATLERRLRIDLAGTLPGAED